MIRAKFACYYVQKSGDSETVHLNAVYGDGEANKEWAKATPGGTLTMTIDNPLAQGKFEQGKEYFLDFTPA